MNNILHSEFLLRAGMLPLGRLESRKRRRVLRHVQRVVARKRMHATHFVFTCGALHAVRDHMYSRLDSITWVRLVS
jgi:hypothetical protein